MQIEEFEKRFQAINRKSAKVKEKQANEFKRVRGIKNDTDFKTVNVQDEFDKHYTFGDKIADKVAKFGGSWSFIIIFAAILITWMTVNVAHLFGAHFDPYPFILLNLALSTIAAFQAPIIMMSQNRQAKRDKLDADNDARTNLRADAKLDVVLSKLDHQKSRNDELDQKINLIAELAISQAKPAKK